MNFQLLQLPGSLSGVTYGFVAIAAVVVVIARLSRGPNLDAFPTVGSSSLLGSWWGGFKFLTSAIDIVQEGYEKHKSAPFKVARQYGWVVVVSNRKHLRELSRASDDELSFMKAADDLLNVERVLGYEIRDNPYHLSVIRSQFTRNIGTMYPEMIDEIVTAFDEVLDIRGNEWKSVRALNAMQKIVCRTSNRLFVGLPLCRNSDWIDLNVQFTTEVAKAGLTVGLLPTFLRSLAACFFTNIAQGTKRGLKHLSPIIEERLKFMHEYGKEWDEKPNDLLSWLMEEAEGPQLTVKPLAARVQGINFAAIHTAARSITLALFYLAANPQYIQPLREEVEPIVEKEGWSKAALMKMHKTDSFLKECQRIEGSGALSLTRVALKDFTFSDGTFIPKGTLIGAPGRSIHYDEEFYENADKFEPFRFSEMREEDGEGLKHQFISTAIDYLSFGHGKHACPGRFFAANELKSMLAHIVVTYDIKLEDNMSCPRSLHFGTSTSANAHAEVLFRKRVD